MVIKRVETKLYRLPLSHPMTDAGHGVHTEFEVVITRLESDCGRCGCGYTYTIGRGGAAIAVLIECDLKPLLLGAKPMRIEQTWERMWRCLHYVGRGGLVAFAMSAVDIALWDLQGHIQGAPLWQLLGGFNSQVRAYAGGIDLQLDPDELVAQTRRNLEAGFRAIKIKIGRDKLSEDVARVRAGWQRLFRCNERAGLWQAQQPPPGYGGGRQPRNDPRRKAQPAGFRPLEARRSRTHPALG